MTENLPLHLGDMRSELAECLSRQPSTPSKLRRFFLLLLREHWSDPGNYGPDLQDTLSCMVWKPESSYLTIELQGAKNPALLQHAIWLNLGNFRPRKLSIGNRAGFEEDNATDIYATACTAQLLIHHDAPSLDVAFDMAWSTFCFLFGFQEAILEGLGGEGAGFMPTVVAEPRQEEPGPKERFRVDVGADLSLNVFVSTTRESHTLKNVKHVAHPIQ